MMTLAHPMPAMKSKFKCLYIYMYIYIHCKLLFVINPISHWYLKGHGFKSRTGLNFFSGLILTTA